MASQVFSRLVVAFLVFSSSGQADCPEWLNRLITRRQFNTKVVLGATGVIAVLLGAYFNSGSEKAFSLTAEEQGFLDQDISHWSFEDFKKAVPRLASLLERWDEAYESHLSSDRFNDRLAQYGQPHVAVAGGISELIGADTNLFYADDGARARVVSKRVFESVKTAALEMGLAFPTEKELDIEEQGNSRALLRAFAETRFLKGTTSEQRQHLLAVALESLVRNNLIETQLPYEVTSGPMREPTTEDVRNALKSGSLAIIPRYKKRATLAGVLDGLVPFMAVDLQDRLKPNTELRRGL